MKYMNNDKDKNQEFDIKPLKLTSKEQVRKFLIEKGLIEEPEEIDNFTYFDAKELKKRSAKLYREENRKFIAITVSAFTAMAILGGTLTDYVVNEPYRREEALMAQAMKGQDDVNKYSPENLVFDKIVPDASGLEYRIVVTKDGDCSYVSLDYSTPFDSMDGIPSRDRAELSGFDFNSLSTGRIK